MASEAFIQQDLYTVVDFIRWAASRFSEAGLEFAHGTDNAIDEAHNLVLRSLNLPHNVPEQFYQARLTGTEKRLLMDLVQRRVDQRIPVAYLLNEAWFAGMAFYVDQRVLIPRSPIAEMIDERFKPWVQPEQVHHILDLCTGSGCIAIACAVAFPDAIVDAVDISADALDVAEINVDRYQLADQVNLYESDLFDDLPEEARYDIIVTNPPYVDATEMSLLSPEHQHEPPLGLAAGEDGLDLVRDIIHEAVNRLTDHGILVVEVGASQYAMMDAFPNLPLTWVEFARGGEGVFVITAAQLRAASL